jgi:hypothetical protein
MPELLPYEITEELLQIKQADIKLYPKPVQVRWLLTMVIAVIGEWRGDCQPTYGELAFELNCRNIRSPRGQLWNAAMLYNGLKYHDFRISDYSHKPAKLRTSAARNEVWSTP